MTQPALFGEDISEGKHRQELYAAGVETAHYRDLWMRLLHTRDRWANGVRAAAERRAREQAYGLIVAALPETLSTMRRLAQAVLGLPERPAPSELVELRRMAETVDTWNPQHGTDAQAVAAIQKIADAEIDEWRSRATEYWNRAQRDRTELIAADDTYSDLVAAGWKPPEWRVQQWRATQSAPPVQDSKEGGTFRNDPERFRPVPYVSGQHRTTSNAVLTRDKEETP